MGMNCKIHWWKRNCDVQTNTSTWQFLCGKQINQSVEPHDKIEDKMLAILLKLYISCKIFQGSVLIMTTILSWALCKSVNKLYFYTVYPSCANPVWAYSAGSGLPTPLHRQEKEKHISTNFFWLRPLLNHPRSPLTWVRISQDTFRSSPSALLWP